MTEDEVDTQAQLSAIKRRIDVLETLSLGEARKPLEPEQAVYIYVEAARLLGHGDVSTEAGPGWARALLALDEPQMVELGRRVEDPTPWGLLLRFIHALRQLEDDEQLRAAQAHIKSVARNVLDAAGLELVEPEDSINVQPPALRKMREV